MLKLDGRRFGWLGREQISAEILGGDVIRLDRSAIFFGGLDSILPDGNKKSSPIVS